jgi:tetratricopeptide (TPR) repeat protein
MAYPGNPELSAQAQERVMTAFRQVVAKLQDGQREEAMIGLEFVLRLDPVFRPALNLQQQLGSGASEIDLSGIISDLQAPTTDDINLLLIEAVEAFEARDFRGARQRVDNILKDLPGHKDARHLLAQIDDALKVESQVEQFLGQAREALAAGDPQEAANFVTMAQALDPHHQGIAQALGEIRAAGGITAAEVSAPPTASPEPGLTTHTGPSFDDVPEDDPRFETVHEDGPTFGDAGAGPDFGTDEFQAPSEAEGTAFSGPDDPFAADPSVADAGPMWTGPDPTESPGADDQLFEATGGDVSDLFEDPSGPAAVATEPPEDSTVEARAQDPVSDLLRRGDEAFEAQQFATAIHAWSRILLLDPDHQAAAQRIDGARVSLEAQRRRVDELVVSAREAAEQGDATTAAQLVTDALELDPTAPGAGVLRDRLTPAPAPAATPAPPPPADDDAGPAVPELDDDLFREDALGEPRLDDLGMGASSATPSDALPELPELPPERRRLRLPVKTVAMVAGGLLVVIVGVWFGLQLFSGSGDVPEVDPARVNEVIVQARALKEQNQVEAALELLRDFPAAGLHQERIDKLIAEYEVLLTPPTPTPIPDAIGVAERLVIEDRFLDAYATVTNGLEQHPRDAGLASLRADILSIEPRLASLHTALSSGRWDAAVGLALELEESHPEWADIGMAANRSLFNASLAQMRAYNLTAAESYLRQLDGRSPDDPEVARVLEFVERYKSRPVDMQLRIFIRSLKER